MGCNFRTLSIRARRNSVKSDTVRPFKLDPLDGVCQGDFEHRSANRNTISRHLINRNFFLYVNMANPYSVRTY
jgi:hypothetical protein